VNLLEVNDLVVRYRTGTVLEHMQGKSPTHVTVLAGVSIAIEAGETLGLIGESGSGKTTLGRALLGLAPISAGSITLADVPVTRSKSQLWRAVRRNVGLMFQDPMAALDPRMTLGASVTEPLAIHRKADLDRRARAIELLEQVGLAGDFVDRYPHQISGGQARRVTVARALALRPKLVVADEPTAGLDLSVQGDLLNLLNDLQEKLGLSFLLITHNLAVARHVTDRIAIMYLGRIIETGRTADIFARPAHPYTRALLVSRGATERARPLAGEVPSLRRRPVGCEFHTRCPIAQEICRAQMPAERLIGNGQAVRCHFPHVEPVQAAGTATRSITSPPIMHPLESTP
jgi:peptide/nickel transport system ATP-binding protein